MTKDNANHILIRNVYYMLAYAFRNLKIADVERIKGVDFDDIQNLFAEILCKGVSYLVKTGLHREYIPMRENLSTVKGKIDINSTIANYMNRRLVIACDYDDFSENNIYNKIIRTTVYLLIKHNDVDKSCKKRLKSLMLFFNDVDIIDAKTIRWESLRFDRNTHTYQFIINLCHLLIDGLLLSKDKGNLLVQHFTEEQMNRLYEKFILEYYKKHYPELLPAASKIKWNTEDEVWDILPEMRSDITLTSKDGRTLIIDAKYYSNTIQTNYEKETVHSHNVYQIYTYVMNKDYNHEGNVDGMLLYARVKDSNILMKHQTLKNGNVLFFRTLDLNVEFEEIRKQLNIIADTINDGSTRFTDEI